METIGRVSGLRVCRVKSLSMELFWVSGLIKG